MRQRSFIVSFLSVSLFCIGVLWSSDARTEEKLEDFRTLPESVRNALLEHRQGAEPSQVEKKTVEGLTYFEAEFGEDGAESEIKLDEEGRIVEEERELPTSELPAAAMKSVESEYPDAEIEEVELVMRTYYEVELESDGKGVTLLVLENGFVLDPASALEPDDEDEGEDDDPEESQVAWDDLPEVVQKAFLSHREGVQPLEIEMEKSGDRVYYEGEYEEENGVEHEIKVDASGMVIEVEDEMDGSRLPDSIKAAVQSKYPDAEIEEASLKRSTYYVVELEIDEKEVEVKVLGNGMLLGLEEDD